jgi:hypothetical protein
MHNLGHRLADFLEEILEPGLGDIEGLAAFDPGKFDRAEFVTAFFIVTDEARDSGPGALDGLENAGVDELEVLGVGRSGAGEIAAFLHEGLLGAEHRSKAFREPFSGVDGVGRT